MSTHYEDMVERFTKRHGDKFSEENLDQRFRPFYDSQQRIQVQYIGSEQKHYGTVGITSGWKPMFILMNNARARSSSVTLDSNVHLTGVNVHGRTYRPVVTLPPAYRTVVTLPPAHKTVQATNPPVPFFDAIPDDLDLHHRCVEHGNINCQLRLACQSNGTEYQPLATCLKCSRPFHPNTWKDVAHRHYCEACIITAETSKSLITIANSPAAMIDGWLERIARL